MLVYLLRLAVWYTYSCSDFSFWIGVSVHVRVKSRWVWRGLDEENSAWDDAQCPRTARALFLVDPNVRGSRAWVSMGVGMTTR